MFIETYKNFLINQETGESLNLTDILNVEENQTHYVKEMLPVFLNLLKFCYANNYKQKLDMKKLCKNSYFASARTPIDCVMFALKNKHGAIVKFINFASKFGVDYSDYATNLKLLNYAKDNGRNCSSLGADAFNEFVRTKFFNLLAGIKILREDENFPMIEYDILNECKKNVAGYQYCKKGRYNNVFSYDITSSYPANMYSDMPTGKGRYFDNIEDVPSSYFYVVKFCYLTAKLNENYIDFLDIENKQDGVICLPKNLFKLFLKTYTCETINVLQILAFKTKKNIFKKFIDKNILRGKELEKDKAIKKYNKLIANSLTGYFGKNTIRETAVFKHDNNTTSVELIEQKRDPIYLPVYIAILDSAKAKFITTLNAHKDVIIYANTDGFISLQAIDTNALNNGVSDGVGAYKFKGCYKDIYIRAINSYCGLFDNGEFDVCMSGVPLDDSPSTVDDFINCKYSASIPVIDYKTLTYSVHSLSSLSDGEARAPA